jgi:hypothetical protein
VVRRKVRVRRKEPGSRGEPVGSWELIDGNHELMLSWDEFQRITAKRVRMDPASIKKRQGGRPSDIALLSRVAFCAHCGHGIWHKRGGKRRQYACGNVRQANNVCDAHRFDATRAEEAIVAHLDTLFVDFAGWLEDVTTHPATQRDGLVRELADLHGQRAALDRDEELVRADYMKHLLAENGRAGELAIGELDRIIHERTTLQEAWPTSTPGSPSGTTRGPPPT